MDTPVVTDPMTALAWGFLARVALCVVWLAAAAALVTPVLVDGADCGTAIGSVFGVEDIQPSIQEPDPNCTAHTVPQVVAGGLVAIVAVAVSKPLLAQLDRAARVER